MLAWLVLIHVTAAVGLVLFPIPSPGVALGALAVCWLGGIGTTVVYHRALAHRSVRLNGAVRSILTFFAVLNGSATPVGWVANHRYHHAHSDTPNDPSSPTFGGFWWAHMRWIWQAGVAPRERYCPDLKGVTYRVWDFLQPGILTLSFLGGLLFGLEAFFWLGAIRIVFALHGQCFVNSICHMRPAAAEGDDASRNVWWLAIWHLFQGENWHRNHHEQPRSARIGWTKLQLDAGWLVILVLERLRLASEVVRPRPSMVLAAATVRERNFARAVNQGQT